MLDFHSSFRTNGNFSNISKASKHESQPLLYSARPKIEQLPFLNNLKMARKLLVALKNQKLRNSLYVVTEGSQKLEKEDGNVLRHEKAKLSVMDLISEEGKFEELSNTIQSNLNKPSESISPIMMEKKSSSKEGLHQFNIENNQPLKGKQQNPIRNTQNSFQPIERSTVLTRKNQLASQLNKLGHELEQTYFQVEELQKIFSILCNFYEENRKTVDKNLKMKQQKDLLKEQLQQFETKIMRNQQKQIQLKDQQDDFLDACKQITKKYLKQLIPYNRQISESRCQLQKIVKQTLSFPIQNKNQGSTSFQQNQDHHEQKHFHINLKFKQIKSELEKIKTEKKNTALNKNNQRKNKNETQENNTFNKLYVSQIQSL